MSAHTAGSEREESMLNGLPLGGPAQARVVRSALQRHLMLRQRIDRGSHLQGLRVQRDGGLSRVDHREHQLSARGGGSHVHGGRLARAVVPRMDRLRAVRVHYRGTDYGRDMIARYIR